MEIRPPQELQWDEAAISLCRFHFNGFIVEETLDADIHEKYQGNVLCGCYPLCSGVRGVCLTPHPNPFMVRSSHRLRRYNLTNSHFQSRQRERNHGHGIDIMRAPTGGHDLGSECRDGFVRSLLSRSLVGGGNDALQAVPHAGLAIGSP